MQFSGGRLTIEFAPIIQISSRATNLQKQLGNMICVHSRMSGIQGIDFQIHGANWG